MAEQETEMMRSDLWSGLPVGILNMIIGYLCHIDNISFRAVCKNWRLACFAQSFPTLPWLISHDWEWADNGNIWSTQKFHIPCCHETRMFKHEIDRGEWGNIFGACVCASKFGWLLLQKSSRTFLYDPFSREMLKLPNMDVTFNRTTFSSVPGSPDCVVFAIQSSKRSNTITISTCHPGDPEWTTKTFNGFSKAVEDVVYSNGVFYCVFSGGVLGAYYVSDLEWDVLTGMEPIRDHRFDNRAHMILSDGEIYLVYNSRRFYCYTFNWSIMGWVTANTLGNKAFFLGSTSFAISTVGRNINLAGRIYYHGDQHTFFSKLSSPARNRCSEFYPWVTLRGMEKVWIEPPML